LENNPIGRIVQFFAALGGSSFRQIRFERPRPISSPGLWPDLARFGVAAQTTQPIEKVRGLVDCLRRRFPNSEVRFIDTVCQPTKQRQNAAIELAQRSDVVVVIGGAHSNNTHELVKTCSRYCERVHHVQTAEDLRVEWFGNAEVIGVTAGTSTPDSSIREVENWLEEFAGGKLQIPNSKLQRSTNLQTPMDEVAPAVHRG